MIHRKPLARKLLGPDPTFTLLLDHPKALSHFEKAIKSRIARLEKNWKEAKETLGVTGAGLPNEEAIWNASCPIRDKWNEIKEICPWFNRMRDMVEGRFDDVGAAITKSETDVILEAAQGGDRKSHNHDTEMDDGLGDDDGSGGIGKEDDGSGGNDDDEDDVGGEDGERRVINPTPTTAAQLVLYNASQATSSPGPSQSTLSLPNHESSTRRKPSVISELTDEMRHSSIAKNGRKRLRDIGGRRDQTPRE